MAEATRTKKPRRKKGAAAAPAAPTDGGILSGWRVWGGAGVLLLGSVVGWRLLGVSFHADVQTICDGEKSSGYSAQKDTGKLATWIRDHLGTPEGNQFFSSMNDSTLADRAKLLQGKASELEIDRCPMVQSLQQVAAEGEYRADVQHLCSRLTFPKLDELDDDARMAKVTDWVEQQGKSPRTKDLLDALTRAPQPQRSKLLADAAGQLDVFTCETAKTLNLPQQPAKVKGPPSVRPYAAPQIVGPLPEADFARSLVDATPAMNQCYAKGLEKKADLEGRMAIKVQIDPSGKVTNVGMADSKVSDKDTTACILQALREMHAPKNAGPLVSILLPLELTTITATAAPSGALTLPQGIPATEPSGRPAPGGSAAR